MSFPSHIEQVLQAYGVRADTRAALFDLYLALGDEVLDVFAEIAEGGDAAAIGPEATEGIRRRVVERYLRRVHPQWMAGKPTASLWHPRAAEGRASGAAIPIGGLPDSAQRAANGEPLPAGVLMLGRNAHYGGRPETISFDVVDARLDDAIALAVALGQQHTLPGSAGGTSGTFDGGVNVALLWEVQPNVYKPAGERNRAIAKLYRRHRNWHLATLAAAVEWVRAQGAVLFVLRGAGLATTHEVNPQKPVSATIAALHDRTVERVAAGAGGVLLEPTEADGFTLLDSCVMNHALRQHVLRNGAEGMVWRVGFSE